jgi:5-carboxymethyl-2-hydroxymuconate isomerase
MGTGRTDATKKRAGDAILARATAHFDSIMKERLVGITVQVDESPGQVYDGKHSNLHPLFQKT